MRFHSLLLPAILLPTTLFASTLNLAPEPAATVSLATDLNVTKPTAVPGRILHAGIYKISIVEHLTDRVILQVSDSKGKIEATFLGLTNSGLPKSVPTGPIYWQNSHQDTGALRGFAFSRTTFVEFVYPKAEAVAIAKDNTEHVLAIDPESDNLHLTNDKLSRDDMQVVTLWALASTSVGPNDKPAISASRYQAPPKNEIASNTPPPSPGTGRVAPSPARTTIPVRKPSVAALPHTASNLPEILLGALVSLFSALALRLRRLRTDAI